MSELALLLQRGLDELGLSPGAEAQEKLLGFVSLLARWAPRMNLTGHEGEEAILRRLVLDAVALWGVLPRPRSAVDLGSGAGVPGFPIGILAPSLPLLLVEARLRRHHFQKAARRELALDNVRLLRGRIESLDPEPAGLVLAQAVATPSQVLEWMLPWALPGAWLAIPCSPGGQGPDLAGKQLEEARFLPYRVPLGGQERCVWLGKLEG